MSQRNSVAIELCESLLKSIISARENLSKRIKLDEVSLWSIDLRSSVLDRLVSVIFERDLNPLAPTLLPMQMSCLLRIQ